MEAAAFVLLQLHETNKHTVQHKETSKRLCLKQNMVFVRSAGKKCVRTVNVGLSVLLPPVVYLIIALWLFTCNCIFSYFLWQKIKFRVFLNAVGCCLRKVGGLAVSVLGEF